MEPIPFLRVRNLRAGYGALVALESVSFDLREGRTLGILGPGGSGKSTLLKVLGGRPDKGRTDLWYEGQLLLPAVPATVVEQKPRPDDRSLAQRLGETGRIPLEEVWRSVPAAACLLRSLLDRPVAELPFGAARLVELTLALAGDPGLLFLDEPEAGLDDLYQEWVSALLRDLKGRTSLIVATHHLALARSITHANLLLVRGNVIETGETEDFFTQPVHPRTQHFIRMGS